MYSQFMIHGQKNIKLSEIYAAVVGPVWHNVPPSLLQWATLYPNTAHTYA